MERKYIDVPQFTTLKEIKERNYTLSASQYKKFYIKNDNQLKVEKFLDRSLTRSDLGTEVGSNNYVGVSDFTFIKTKALQEETYLISEIKDAMEYIAPKSFVQMNLKKGDILISKDSNVGEIAILDKDYLNSMLCGGIYRLPVSKHKYYLLAFIKSDLFRQQIDFLVPRGSTIRHGKTKFLDCMIPIPKRNEKEIIQYVEVLMKAIIDKEIAVRKKYENAMVNIDKELLRNQKNNKFIYELPTIQEIIQMDRMDSSIYDKGFKQKEFIIRNYRFGTSTIKELGFSINRGQNLQVSNIGESIQTKDKRSGYYKLILPNYISKYGTISKINYFGNSFKLKTLKQGDIIFGAEGNEKGRSYVVVRSDEMTITNIHGITLNHSNRDLKKSIVVKLFLDYYRKNGMIDAYAVGGNGGSMAIKYWDFLRFPNFPADIEKKLAAFYFNDCVYETKKCTSLDEFVTYNKDFDRRAGIYEIDNALKYLQNELSEVIHKIANDEDIEIMYKNKTNNLDLFKMC